MFRGRSVQPDVAEAARRRLAQLAAEFAAPGSGPPRPGSEQGSERPGSERPPLERLVPDRSPGTDPESADDRPTVTDSAPPVPERRHAAPSPRGALAALRVSTAHVATTLVAGLVLVAVAGWMWWHSRPETTSLESPAGSLLTTGPPARNRVVSPPTSARPTATTSSRASATTLVIDVEGRVRRPGIVELPAGSRVVDAIRAAGGAPRHRQLRTVNLARPLVDGEQIVVGMPAPATTPEVGAGTAAPSASPGAQRVDLNTATLDQLEALPQVGPVTAQAIITWRTENGRFTSVDELLDVTGIGDKTLAQLRPYVYV